MMTETPRDATSTIQQDSAENSAMFAIEGMTCASCATRIEKGLGKVPGVKFASVNLARERANVTYESAQTTIDQMVQKVDAIGYKAIPLVVPSKRPIEVVPGQKQESTAVLNLEGMTCASCAIRIEKCLGKMPGVKDASVNMAIEQVTVTFDPLQTGLEQMVQQVEAVGYKATPQVASITQEHEGLSSGTIASSETPVVHAQVDELSQRRQAEITRKRNLLILGIILTLLVVVLSMFFMNRFPGENYLLLALTTPVWAIVGWEFHRVALGNLRYSSANMDTLISLGSTAAYAMSVVATFFPQVVGSVTFYDTASLIITLIFLGKYLEARAKGQTNEAIKKLMGLQARTAHVIRNGNEIDLPIEQVHVGDELVMRPGEKVPVDGVVLSGTSLVDES
jgi:Cu+-exporting ATPase